MPLSWIMFIFYIYIISTLIEFLVLICVVNPVQKKDEKVLKRLNVKTRLAMKKFAVKMLVIGAVIMLFFALMIYIFTPTITPIFVVTFAVFVAIATLFVEYSIEYGQYFLDSKRHMIAFATLVSVLLLLLVINVISGYLFASYSYKIAEETFSPVKTTELTSGDFSNLSYSDIQFTVIPYQTAFRRMSSATSKYGILYRVSDADYQMINGSVYWVGSVTYGSFWKWLKNKDKGIPFVLLLKATSNDEAHILKLKEPMRYTLYNYFGNDVKRHIWEKYPEYKITTPVLQIHDGKAYYLAMLMKPVAKTLWSCSKVYKLAVVDAHTGKITLYDPDKAPSWTTFVHQEDEVEKFLYDYFVYVHGFWNSILSQKDVIYPTGNIGIDLQHHKASMYGTDVWLIFIKGHPYWYSALRPPSSEYAMVALALVDAKTGRLTVLNTPGFYNDLASVQNILQSPAVAKTNTLMPTQPIPILIDGHFGWLSTVISENKELQFFALVDASNGKVYTGDTVSDVIHEWLSSVGENVKNVSTKRVAGGVYKVVIRYANGTVKEFTIPLNSTVEVVKNGTKILVFNAKK